MSRVRIGVLGASALALFLAVGCSSRVKVGEVEEIAHATADVLAALDESLEPFHSHRLSPFLHEDHPIEIWEPCTSLGWSFCDSGERVRYVSDCASGLGSHLEGEIRLRFSDPLCPSTPSVGLKVEHRALFSLSGRDDSATAQVSSDGESRGSVLTLGDGEAFSWQVRGLSREAGWNRSQPWTQLQIQTLEDIQGEGHGRSERVLTQGQLLVTDSVQGVRATLSLTLPMRFEDTECNCPVGGEWSGTLTQDASGERSELRLTFPSCGTAQLILKGEASRLVRLDRCGKQPL